ncbi:methylthioribose-1-phosphate isomerase [candidate division TA06 bacterium DG_24]|jgi:methylthioribose-1-phosphate isomerase|uniref:Methylthioribose-1-phosphate isomerase n=3 Tax=Bacteria division TA06 TaxID=1156500 RepID=A0A0S8JSF4_UNCT6|nr:MAG: methylthioribose-1-phosphate isomerase [candidate division TA06 bacterium DG_24]KPK70865.1 MAG: methylthioribose-1-phosphate isomerase [candidate division TA06 bacterium SM23_40]KPL11582.1 MAG: methylthioribose-1-phosphate isomerase [candidate division TA06 bacterium SM1_40]
MEIRTVEWADGVVRLIDQRRLPHSLAYIECRTGAEVADAIQNLSVRGAPAIGVAAAMGMVLSIWYLDTDDRAALQQQFRCDRALVEAARPTAINLRWALDRMEGVFTEAAALGREGVRHALLEEAKAIAAEDLAQCRTIGEYGARLIGGTAKVMTYCNAGALATAGWGTALGVIRSAREKGKQIHVFVPETRPVLQGARLTAWELVKEGIGATLICDGAAAHIMRQERIDCVIVGADRIARNGDVANKIGTYGLAISARRHGIPFYVAAPVSTFDLSIGSGAEIPIEERGPEEVREIAGHAIAPADMPVRNPAFDVTPAELVSAIVTERGIIEEPVGQNLPGIVAEP